MNIIPITFMCSDTVARSSIKTASYAHTTCMMLENTATSNNARSRTELGEPSEPVNLSKANGHPCEWERHIYSCNLDQVKFDYLDSFDV